MTHTSRKYMTAADAADYIGYTTNTLAQYRCRRIGPSYLKVRGRVLYAVEELDRWIANHARVEIPIAHAQFEG